MSAIIQASPIEKLSQEPLPTGDSCVLIIFGASGDLTKRKLIQSLVLGTPAVSTSVGTEGLGLADGEHVLVADDPESFARGGSSE